MTARNVSVMAIAVLFASAVFGTSHKPHSVAQREVQPASESKRTKPLASKGKRMRVTVTAYCQIPKSSKWTAKRRQGTCAVDPRVIPYGSIVRVAGRNLTAMGRHGKNGRVVDIFMPNRDQCLAFGRRAMWARVERRGK